jgi:hypothetical protein
LEGIFLNKAKRNIALLLSTIMICVIVSGCSIKFFGDSKSGETAKKTNQSNETASAESSTSLESSISSSDNNEVKVKKPVIITEGILIKKYPGNFACFKFETPDGIKIITDPYEMDETVEPYIVTESHQHGDHTDVSKLKGTYKLINTIEDFSEKGIKIKAYSGKHNKGDTEGTNYIYVFDINGIRIAHFASQGELPTDETLKKIGKVDILLIQASFKPQYADSKLNVNECAAIIKILDPKIIIPEHGAIKMGQVIADKLGIKLEHLNTGELAVTRNGLDTLKKIEVDNLDTGYLY